MTSRASSDRRFSERAGVRARLRGHWRPLNREAAAKLDAERTERERAARAVVSVNRRWLLNVLRDAIAVAERDLARAIELGDYGARLAAARKGNRLRDDYAYVKTPPT